MTKPELTLAHHIQETLQHYPTAAGISEIKAAGDLLVCNGNAMEWTEHGQVVYLGPTSKAPNRHPEIMLDKIFKKLATIPVVTEKRDRGHVGHFDMIWKFPEEFAEDEKAWEAIDSQTFYFPEEEKVPEGETTEVGKKDGMDLSVVLKIMAEPIKLGNLDHDYTLIGRMPENVQPDYARAIAELLQIMLVVRPGEREGDNSVNALTLLLEYAPILSKHCSNYPTTEEILHARRKYQARMLELDIKRHSGNHRLDESKLSNAEYAEHKELSHTFQYLSEERQTLLRRYHQYLEWKEEDDFKKTAERETKDYKNKKKFWRAATIKGKTVTAKVEDPEVLNWTKFQKAFSKI